MPERIVIADTSCLIALTNIEAINILKGRKEAEKLGFKITGTLGVLFKAKQSGIISELKAYLEKLKIVGFRISEKIEIEILKRSNEK